MKSIFRILFITGIVLIAGCEESRFVARVGNSAIYVKDFKAALIKEKGVKTYENIPINIKEKVLDSMIDEKLQLLDAYRNNLDTDEKVLRETQKSEIRYVYDTVLEDQVINKIITEKDYRDRYDKLSREIKIQHILLPPLKIINEEQKQKRISQLDSLRSLILRGADFAVLARKFSKDSLSAGKGGDLGFIKWEDAKYNDIFYNQIFNLKKGDVSQVFETKRGFHLVKALQSRPVPVEPFEIQKPLILKTFFRERINELNKGYFDFLRSLEQKNPASFNEENIQYFVDFVKQEMDSLQTQGKQFNVNDLLKTIDTEKTLFEFGRNQYTIKEFVAELKTMYPVYYPGIYSSQKINENLKRLSSRELIINYGYKYGFNKKKSVKEKVLQRKNELMINEVNNLRDINNIDKDDMKTYYEENEDMFRKPDKYKVMEIRVKDKELAEKIYEEAANKGNFESLCLKYNENPNTKNKNGDLGYIGAKQFGSIGETAATLDINELSKPIEFDGNYVIIKVMDIIQGELTPFKENNRGMVITLKKQMVKERKDKWFNELKMLYPVIKYENVLENVYKKKEII